MIASMMMICNDDGHLVIIIVIDGSWIQDEEENRVICDRLLKSRFTKRMD